MNKISMGEAIRIFLSDFLNYFVIWICFALMSLVAALLQDFTPGVGFVAVMLSTLVSIPMPAITTYRIMHGEDADISKVFKSCIDKELWSNVKIKKAIKTLILIDLVASLVIFAGIFFGVNLALTSKVNGVALAALTAVAAIPVFIVIAFVTVYMRVKMSYYIVDDIMGVYDFYDNHKDKFKYSWLWCTIPLFNVISDFAIMIQYIQYVKDNTGGGTETFYDDGAIYQDKEMIYHNSHFEE